MRSGQAPASTSKQKRNQLTNRRPVAVRQTDRFRKILPTPFRESSSLVIGVSRIPRIYFKKIIRFECSGRIPISTEFRFQIPINFQISSSIFARSPNTRGRPKRNDDDETTTTITHPPSRLSSEEGRSSLLHFSVTPNFGRNDFLRFRSPARHRRHPKEWTMTIIHPRSIPRYEPTRHNNSFQRRLRLRMPITRRRHAERALRSSRHRSKCRRG